jgi:putative ABC transport system permease protein
MKNKNAMQPPRWAQRFLEWYCRPDLLEDLQGDLNEYFDRHQKKKGLRRARLIYIADVFKFFRPYTIRKPEFLNLLIHWIMIGSYIKTSGRSLVRNKLFSAINIIGLAISMSVGLLMIAFLTDILSYDKFHEKGGRIYRVINDYQFLNERIDHMASTSVRAGKKIKESISGVEDVVIMRRGFGGDATFGDNVIPMEGLYATESLFKIFTFPLLEGNASTALKDPYSIVLTERSAKKLFGNENALGKVIKFGVEEKDHGYTVTGIMKDISTFSHIQTEAFVSFSTAETEAREDKDFMKWENMWINYVYVLLPENGDPKVLQSNLDKLSKSENALIQNTTITLKLQPLDKISLGEELSNQIGPTMPVSIVWVIAGLGFIVILSACFNYTNLSIARSLRRSREVGIRKVIGAFKGHVLTQFIVEAMIISLLALAFSFLLFLFLRPQFMALAPELAGIVELSITPKLILIFVAFAMLTGVVAGFFPALFYARTNALSVMKDASNKRAFKNISVRKALIVIQYTFSLMFITATIIGYKQYKHFLSFDLGFNTENILNIKLQGNKADLLVKELEAMPETQAISRSQMITSVGNYWGTQMKYKDPLDSAGVYYNTIDENYIPLHGQKLIAGKNFTHKKGEAEETEVIVSEEVLKRFNIAEKNPAKALGEEITLDGKKLTIIGVIKNFQYGRANSPAENVLFRYSNEKVNFINLKILSKDLPATMANIETVWKKFDKVHPLDATFYSDQIEKAYSEFSAMIKIIGVLAFLAIVIASIGLLGMIVFITETRLKEISIRKVLGASEGKLIYLLSRGFLVLLLISAIIALPATYLFFEKVILVEIVNHAPIGIMELIVSVIVVMGIALIMIWSQTLKVARANPAEVLKAE